MAAYQQRYYPGDIYAINLRCGSTIVAIDGTLRVEYRDRSLDWLVDSVPSVSVTVAEGAPHVLACNALVRIRVEGATSVSGLISCPTPLAARFMERIRTFRRGVARALASECEHPDLTITASRDKR